MCEVGDLGEEQEVIAAEAVRTLPLVTLAVDAREDDAVAVFPSSVVFIQIVALTRPKRIASAGFVSVMGSPSFGYC